MGKIFCFIGKSSSGKDTIFKSVFNDFDGIKQIVLSTTRPIREGEIDGKDYHFVTDSDFKTDLLNKSIIEYRSYNTAHGIWTYYTSSENIDLEKNDYMTINTLEGYRSLKEYYGNDAVVPIYIEVENGIRLTRALEREKKQENPKYVEMCRRFIEDEKDFSEEKLNENGINQRFKNNDIMKCIIEIEQFMVNILTKEKQYRI